MSEYTDEIRQSIKRYLHDNPKTEYNEEIIVYVWGIEHKVEPSSYITKKEFDYDN